MTFSSNIVGSAVALFWFVSAVAQEEPPSSAALSLFFKRLDQNEDGLVIKSELEAQGRKTELLTSADTDSDGALTRGELASFFKRRKQNAAAAAEALVYDFPKGAPVTEASCRAASEYSAEQNGFSTLVMIEGQLVFEQYDQGWDPAKSNRLASGTKSFSGVILAVAVKDGLLTLDDRVSETIEEWQGREGLESITIRQLLSLTSGMNPGEVGVVPSYESAVVFGKDEKFEAEPGAKFAYGPRPFQIFGEIVTRKLVASDELEFPDPLAYLENRVLDPIEMTYAHWRRDENGMPKLPSGAFFTAREWAKFGELLRNEGLHDGEVLFDQETFRQCLEGSETFRGYGLTFWLLDAQPSRLAGRPWLKGGFMAAGAGKQRLYVLPAAGAVVVRQGESKKDFEDIKMLDRLLDTSAPSEQKETTKKHLKTNEPAKEEKDSDFIGMLVEDGDALAKKRGLISRIIEIDGETRWVTTDYREDRVNFTISDSTIIKVTRG
jgi:CubicO group peptidase (beta-lactamase class C family)